MIGRFLKTSLKMNCLVLSVLFLLSMPAAVRASENSGSARNQKSVIERLRNAFQKDQKPKKLESGPGTVSAKQMKRYCENKLKELSVEIKKLDLAIEDSRAEYEKCKQVSWELFMEKSRLEQRTDKDAEEILDLHEKRTEAKKLEEEALAKYQKDARDLLEAQKQVEQCRDEIEKAKKMLDFTGQKY